MKKANMRAFVIGIAAIICGFCQAHTADFARDIRPLLEVHCFDCHGNEEKPKGGVNLERFKSEDDVMRDRSVWGGVLEKMESHQMPPPKQKAQPTEADRAKVLVWIADIAARPDPVLGARDPGKPVLRRLTRLEYNNTVRDLLGLSTDVFMFPERLPLNGKDYFQPASGKLGERVEVKVREYGAKYPVLLPNSGLPGDNRAEHGYRNRGDAGNFDALTLEKYVAVADEIAESPKLAETEFYAKFIADPSTPEKTSKPVARAKPAAGGTTFTAAKEFAPNKPPGTVAEGSSTLVYQFTRGLSESFEEGSAGVFDAEGKSTTVAAGRGLEVAFGSTRRKVLTLKSDADLWLAGFATANATSGRLLFTNQRKGAKTFTLNFTVSGGTAGEGIVELGVVVLSRRGQSGSVTLTAAFSDGHEQSLTHPLPEGAGAGNTFFAFHAPAGKAIASLRVDGSQFSGDYVLLDDLGFVTARENVSSVAGGAPVAKPESPATAPELEKSRPVKISPKPPREPRVVASERLAEFLPRAFRRPVGAVDVERYLKLFDDAVKSGQSFESGMKAALRAVLSSPSFLYLAEPVRPDQGKVRSLDDFELASRLSYFLWASTPDDELLALARAGKLHGSVALEAQTRRMLKSPKARELSESFAVQWLRLDQLYTSKPDRELFKAFYSGPQGKDTLHAAQLIEALLLFETVQVENRSILDFIAAKYTWLNPRLAKFYGLEPEHSRRINDAGQREVQTLAATATNQPNRELKKDDKNANNFWQRVPLTDAARGGFLTMGAPLTLTSLPFRTSPVKRGAWLLETVFNRPPQEPKVAFAVENDTKEAAQSTSIRQRFEAHRNKAACYTCHVRLDPPGFALERFDAIGRWRETDGGQPVDARGEWNGASFDGPAGYKAALLKNPNEFTRGFIEHLLSYALERKLEIFDQPAVAEIQSLAAQDGNRIGRVIVEIVKSYAFLRVRNTRAGE